MPHIELPEGAPGIRGPMAFRPETAKPLNELAEVLLRGPNTLERGERELIAAVVSKGNGTRFCEDSHSAFAARQLEGGYDVVDAVKLDVTTAPISDKLKALLVIAEQVRESGLAVTDDAVAAAKAEGATDVEIHDTVLIAAAFCMYNRYVDGLGTIPAPSREAYDMAAEMIVEHGYGSTTPASYGVTTPS